ncbi:hypothetical protein QFZ34_001262 [Phyllobacterium ifriqiyense]|uniref:Restriction endonuclease n=1 Tax=Phyllobacterium ifriqiyense TaxID=314238 RepID=A0ABU0S808_9HYPH|nr:hypothetical protein [Phyllobacterium ifriqiyense]MDQ0996085.1 hypothetical protein [Phyllobacterium ifriqiyense]
MKRKKRNPEKFDPVELFTAMGRNFDYKLDAEGDIRDFLDRVGNSLKASISNPAMLHGKRVETMFAHVAGALGRCRLIKQEDAGAVFVNGGDLEIPDYRLVLTDGTALLVEVKNFRSKDYRKGFAIRADYLSKLEAYAALNGLPLKLAVYFPNPNTWVLLSRQSFTADGDIFRVNFVEAIARNEMALLGDRMIATLHDLRIDFLADPAECSTPDANGEVQFTVREIRMSCAGKGVTDEAGKNIAFYLMRYGEWVEQENTAIFQDGKVVGMRFTYAPMEPVEEQGPHIAGTLSNMVSNAYKELTVQSGAVVALDVKHDPDVFSLGIPEGYKGSLPLWQFILQPNYDLRARGIEREEQEA